MSTSQPAPVDRPFAYATTHRITEETGPDGRPALRKDLSLRSLLPRARGVNPAFLVDPAREVAVYERLLPAAGLASATCHASRSDPAVDEHWLLLERVDGPVLWQVGDPVVWDAVLAWVAEAHRRLARLAPDPPAPLLRYDRRYLATWIRRAAAAARQQPMERRARTKDVLESYAALLPRLSALPAGIIHGDLFPSNVVVGDAGGRPRICLVDWELAAVGPAAVDVAALTTGWDEARRSELIGVYAAHARRDPRELADEVALCELHLCIRMLGWSPGWRPPSAHDRDWLGRAEQLAGEVRR